MCEISLLMANYNHTKFIKTAIESVLNQIFTAWELIIIDDASTDNSLDVIRNFLNDPRIRLLQNKTNKGYSASLRIAIKNSSADIIGIIDPDDALRKDALQIIVDAHHNNPDFGLIYSTQYECDKDLKIIRISEWVGKVPKGETNLFKPRVSHFITFKRSAYKKTDGFDPKQLKAVDKDIILKLEEVTKLKFVNIPLYYHRLHSKGISNMDYDNPNLELHYYAGLTRYKAYKRRLNKSPSTLTRKEVSVLFSNIGLYYIRKAQPNKGGSLLLKAIKLDPLKLRYIIFYFLKKYTVIVEFLLCSKSPSKRFLIPSLKR